MSSYHNPDFRRSNFAPAGTPAPEPERGPLLWPTKTVVLLSVVMALLGGGVGYLIANWPL